MRVINLYLLREQRLMFLNKKQLGFDKLTIICKYLQSLTINKVMMYPKILLRLIALKDYKALSSQEIG